MPLTNDELEILIDDLDARLSAATVMTNGARADATYARSRSDEAFVETISVRFDQTVYTDEQIQALRDDIVEMLASLRLSIMGDVGTDTDTAVGGVRDDLTGALGSFEERYVDAMEEAASAYNDFLEFATTDFDAALAEINLEVTNTQGELAIARQDILDEVTASRQRTQEISNRFRNMADEIGQARDRIIEMDYSIYEVKDELYRNLAVEFDGRFATYDERITTAVGTVGAVATAVELLQVNFGDQQASISNVQQAIIDGDNEIAQQIVSLSVGTQTQFDPFQIWHFDTTNEVWLGTWNDGYLDCGDDTESPLLNIDASKYRQVRLRLRRVGTPTWVGMMDWDDATPAGPMLFPEPEWNENLGEITINPLWSGILTKLFFTFTSGADATNKVMIDWVTVGRPAPGASTASVEAERIARISDNEVMAGRIELIEVDYVTADGAADIAASAISGLVTRVEETEEGISATNERVDLLELTINDTETGWSAQLEAFDGLAQRVDTEEDKMTIVQDRVTDLEVMFTDPTSALNVKLTAHDALTQRIEATEDNIDIFQGKIEALETNLSTGATFTALQGLTQRVGVDNSDGSVLSSLLRDFTSLTSTLPATIDGRAAVVASTATDALIQSITDPTSALGAVNKKVTDLDTVIYSTEEGPIHAAQQAALAAAATANAAGKTFFQTSAPPVSERKAVNLWIDTTLSGGIPRNIPKRWNGTAWVAVQDKVALDALARANAAYDELASKVSSAAFDLLANEVRDTDTGLEATASKVTSLTARINDPVTGLSASATGINSLKTRVKATEDGLKATSDLVTSLNSDVGRFSAGGRFRVRTLATPSGAQSRIALFATASDNEGQSRGAGLYIDAFVNGSGNNDSRMIVSANRFAVMDGNLSRALTSEDVPFTIVDDTTFIKAAVIRDLTIGRGKIGDNQITMQWSANATALSFTLAIPADVIVMTSCRIMGTNDTHDTRYSLRINGVDRDAAIFSVDQYTQPYTTFKAMTLPAGTHRASFSYDAYRYYDSPDATVFNTERLAVFAAYK